MADEETTSADENKPEDEGAEETVQVPTALNPDTWPEKTGTVTDPEILAAQGLAPDEPAVDVAGVKDDAPEDIQGKAPKGAEWFQCLVDHLPTKHTFWSLDHLKDPPQQIACPYCGSKTVVRTEGYVKPAFLRV